MNARGRRCTTTQTRHRLPPVAALPLPQDEGGVAVVVGVLVETDRNLPADVWLPVERTLTVSHGRLVQGTPGAVLETGTVQEDARIIDGLRDPFAVAVLEDRPPISGRAPQVPTHRARADRSALGSTVGPPCRRNGAIGATPVLVLRGQLREDSRAALAVDAAIVRGEKVRSNCHVSPSSPSKETHSWRSAG